MDVRKGTTFCVADWQVDPAIGGISRHGNTIIVQPRVMDVLVYLAGRPQEGLKRIMKAMQINPHHPDNYTFHQGQAYCILERYNEAIEVFEKGIASNPASERLYVWLAAAYVQAGEIEAAEWEVDQVLMLNPEFSSQRINEAFPFKDPTDLERLMEGLRIAEFSQQAYFCTNVA